MKSVEVKGIEFLLRRNLGNYEHSEIKLAGVVKEGADVGEAAREMKSLAERALFGTITAPGGVNSDPEKPASQVAADTKNADAAAKAEEKAKKEAAAAEAKAKKEAEAAAKKAEKEAADKAKAEQKAAKKIEKYDRSIKDHTSTFAGYLTKTYGETWKTKEGLKAFSESLNGLDFRDENGALVDSFKAKIEEFFGNGDNVL